MKRIRLLPENLINQIAAGEVIERPASIVKELVENSIDAGATRVEIEISNECRNIRVADNGSGIHSDDVALAFSRHATSKLEQEKDLWAISTLGFRGEALASIISVAKVTCLTRTADSPHGVKVECENSEITISETGCAIGTTMEVKELFYNVPARKKFLKKSQTELASIIEVVQSIAISYPEISIHLIHKGRTTLKTTGSRDLSTVVSEIYSRELLDELVEVYKDDSQDKLEVKGFVSNPNFTRSNKKAIYLFVNGRTVKCPILSKAIDTAYKGLIPGDKYPFAILDLIIPASEVDVNVHPAKREIRYTNPNQMFNFVYSAVKSTLEFNSFSSSTISSDAIVSPSRSGFQSEYKTSSKPYFPVANAQNKVDFSKMQEKIGKSMEFFSPPTQSKIEFNEDITTNANWFKVIGQLFNTYIIIENPEGLQIVDQHIAHERVIYEKLKSSQNFASQLLLTSIPVELEPTQISGLEENRELLAKFGYEYEIENKQVTLKQVPQILVNSAPDKIINDILESLEGSLEHIENKILITTACHAAVKAGAKLSIWQMEELINDWLNTSYNKTCPHGRKISHIINSKEIASFFGRIETN